MTFSSGSPQLEDMLDDVANRGARLGRGERFAILHVLLDRDAYANSQGAARARKTWLTEQGDLARQQLLRMALVLPEGVPGHAGRPIVRCAGTCVQQRRGCHRMAAASDDTEFWHRQ